jgi:hypothetical protein
MASRSLSRALATRQSSIPRSSALVTSRNTSTSALYGMSALSNRNETQYFSKLSRLPLMEHSPSLKLIHTSEVQFGASSAQSNSLPKGSIGSQQQEEDVPTRTSPKSQRTPDKLAEDGDKELLADHTRLTKYSKEVNKIQDQIHRRQIGFLQRRIVSERRLLVKNYRQRNELGAATIARALSQQEQAKKSRDKKASLAESHALMKHKKNLVRLEQQINETQHQLDSSETALAKTLAETQRSEAELDSEDQERLFREENKRREAKDEFKALSYLFSVALGIAIGFFSRDKYLEIRAGIALSGREREARMAQQAKKLAALPTRPPVLLYFDEDAASGSTDLTSTANELAPEAEQQQPTLSVDEPAPEAEHHEPASSADEPALEEAKHQPTSSWTSLLWKKQ